MEQRELGSTGLSVSALGLGAIQVGLAEVDDRVAGEILNRALDHGITLVDTARSYGASEERIGRHLAHRRDDFVLSTKVGYGVEGCEDWTAECVTRGVHRALREMRTDRIEIVHLHSCDEHTLRHAGVLEALAALRESGEIRAVAYSGENEPLLFAVRSGLVDVIQTSVNLVDQHSLQAVIPEAVERGIGVLAKRALANVVWRHDARPEGTDDEEYWDRFQALRTGMEAPESWADVALRFACFAPGVTSCLVGMSNPRNLAANLAALESGALDPGVASAWRDAYARAGQGWRGHI